MYSCKIIRILESGFFDEIAESIEISKRILEDHGFRYTGSTDVDPVMSDLKEAIYADSCSNDMVLVLGGTGLHREDIGPEVVLSLVDKRATGIETAMLRNAIVADPSLCLYRVGAGTIGDSIVLSVPGYHETVHYYLESVLNYLKPFFDGLRASERIQKRNS
jgi:molybdopterin biosynthesis enzyme MoaB